MTQRSLQQSAPAIKDLYPHLSEEELKEAEENLERYLELTLRVYERIRNDPKAYRRFRVLTGLGKKNRIQDKRSNPP